VIKVLAYADAGVNSGFERVMRGVMTHLRDTGNYDITVEGVRYDGNTSLVYPFKVLPLMDPADGYGVLQIDAAIKRHKPDVVWLLNDLWIHGMYFTNKTALEVPVVAYYPVDTPNMKWGYALGLGAASQAVAYTQFGAMETVAGMRSGVDLLFDSFKTQGLSMDARAKWMAIDHPTSNKLHVRLDRLARYQNLDGYRVIPHGMDHDLFEPRDKATCRKQFGLPEDAFIVLSVGTNQFRKRHDLTMRAFKLLADKRPDARLVMHCQGEGMQGWDLQQMARYTGIADKLFLIHAMNKDWNEDELVSLYNTGDVMINTAGGEGWGLCLEASMLVETAGGPRRIDRILPGDRVLTSDGMYHQVLATTQRAVDHTVAVHVQGHLPVESTPEHPFLVLRGVDVSNAKTRYLAGTPAWVRADAIVVGDHVATGLPAPGCLIPATVDLVTLLSDEWEHDVEYVWHPMGFSPDEECTSIVQLMEVLDETKKVVEKAMAVVRGRRNPGTSERVAAVTAYITEQDLALLEPRRYPRYVSLTDAMLEVIGWYVAEGSIYDNYAAVTWDLNGLTEMSVAEMIVRVVEEAFGVQGTISICDGVNPGTKLGVQVNAQPAAKFFEAMGGMGSYHKRLDARLSLTDPRIIQLWRGYMRGDGHVAEDGSTAATSVSAALLLQLQLSLRSLGIRSSVTRHTAPYNEKDAYRLVVPQGHAGAFWGQASDRRVSALAEHDGYVWSKVTDVVHCPWRRDVHDLSVEGTHNFVAHNILVHNTSVEAAACGIPQLVPDWSATREIWNGYGLLLPVADFRMEPKYLNTIHANIDVRAAADALILMAEDETRRSAVGDLCKYRADSMWSWAQVGTAFDRVIQEALVEGPAVEMSFQEVLDRRKGEVRSELEGMALLPPREVTTA
jgi:glycosyltransferase involved in cell wall biosynthesis